MRWGWEMFWRKPRDVEFGSPRQKAEIRVENTDKDNSGQGFRITQSLALQILVLLIHWAVFTAFVLFCSAVIYWFFTSENASVWGVLSRIFGSKSMSAVFMFWGLPVFCAIDWLAIGKFTLRPWKRWLEGKDSVKEQTLTFVPSQSNSYWRCALSFHQKRRKWITSKYSLMRRVSRILIV